MVVKALALMKMKNVAQRINTVVAGWGGKGSPVHETTVT